MASVLLTLRVRTFPHAEREEYTRRRILSGFGGYATRTHQPLGVLVPYISGDNRLADGHYAGSREIEEHIAYVAQTEEGHHITLPPAEFQKRYGWRNDPTKARLLKFDP